MHKCVCTSVCALSRNASNNIIGQDTQNLFQNSLVAETHELPVPSTQSLPHSSGQPLTKGGRFHCPLVVHGVISGVELGRGQIPAFVSSHLTRI